MKNRIFFSSFHPIVLAAFFFSELVITMFSQNPVVLAISFLGAVAFFVSVYSPLHIKKDVTFLVVLFVVITATNPLFSRNGVTVLFYVGDIVYTLESLLYGADLSLMIVSVIIWFKCLDKIMTDDKTQYLFARKIPKISMIITMSLRFIPLYRKQLEKIRQSQQALGVYNEKSKFSLKVRNACDVFLSLVTWSLENSVETGMSMKARAYQSGKRTNFSVYKFKTGDLVLLLSVILFFVSAAISLGLSESFVFFPTFSKINTDLNGVILYTAFAALSFLPFITEITENIKWKYYESKI